MSEALQTALNFLISTIFDLFLFILVVRVILVYVGANYFNPLVQFVVKLTNWIVKPLLRIIPNVKRIEIASIILILLVDSLKFFLLMILIGRQPALFGLLILVLGDFLKLLIMTFFYAIILQAILTWVQPHSPISHILDQFTSPIMRPIQRVIPPIGGIDISPIPALILLQLLLIVLVNPILFFGYASL